MALVLGGFIFTDYSIPEKVRLGGAHNFVVHKLIGGTRIVDAMGPDDDDIRWAGRFQGPDALSKALLLDGLRRAGTQMPLVVDSQYYMVGIHMFDWEYERSYQILYRIECLVVANAGGAPTFSDTLTSSVTNDLALANAVINQLSGAL